MRLHFPCPIDNNAEPADRFTAHIASVPEFT